MPDVLRIPLGYNNVYAVPHDGRHVVIDTGPDYDGAATDISRVLAGPLPHLVIATHAHMDHAGLGSWWRSRGVPVALGAADLHVVTDPAAHADRELDALERYVRTCGAPAEVQAEAIAALGRRRQWARIVADPAGPYPPEGRPRRWPTGLRYAPFVPAQLLAGGTALPAGLSAIPCPGHTPGNLVVVHEGEGWLFSGDQLLPEITPTPAIQLAPAGAPGWRYRSLPAFRDSLRRLAAHGFTRCFPGHGEPFDDVSAVIAANLAAIAVRSDRLLDELRAAGPSTVYALAERLYPRALRRRFWQIVATVQGHIDILEAEGRAAVTPEGACEATP